MKPIAKVACLALLGSGLVTGAGGHVVLRGALPPADNGTMLDGPVFCAFSEKARQPIDRCGRASLPEIARRWLRSAELGDAVCLTVIGRASDGGGPHGDDRLSTARAGVVADRLRALGIPGRAFAGVYGVGSRQPLVPGDPGNPQNRLAEIRWQRYAGECQIGSER